MKELPRNTPAEAFARLVEIIGILRSENGCPWDREQTHESLRSDLLEETYEVLEAIEERAPAKLTEELGDLLINIALHARIAEEADDFDFLRILNATNAKLVRRHPHVFGEIEADTSEQVLRNWEAIKKNEEGYETRTSVLDGVPASLPALMAAWKLQKKAARVGFDWERVKDVLPKVREEIGEIEAHLDGPTTHEELEMEVGDLLFAAVNLARFLKVEPETALRRANGKFTRRFQRIEAMLAERGEAFSEHTLDSLDKLWDEIKRQERASLRGAVYRDDT